jgi:hypothetical protein
MQLQSAVGGTTAEIRLSKPTLAKRKASQPTALPGRDRVETEAGSLNSRPEAPRRLGPRQISRAKAAAHTAAKASRERTLSPVLRQAQCRKASKGRDREKAENSSRRLLPFQVRNNNKVIF